LEIYLDFFGKIVYNSSIVDEKGANGMKNPRKSPQNPKNHEGGETHGIVNPFVWTL
jgi:hypothetical protein